MSLFGNLIWLIFGGIIAALGYIIGGLALCLTIIGIPFGMQSIRLGFACLTPFGKTVIEQPGGDSSLRFIFNIIWVVLFGWEIALAHLVSALLLAITIVGLPFAKQHLKLTKVAIFPFTYDLR